MLGDRVRMQEHAGDRDVFIRSMAARGHAGGLAPTSIAAAAVLDAAGFDLVLIETVGTGQSEVEVAAVADTTVVVAGARDGRRGPGDQGRPARGGRPGRRQQGRPTGRRPDGGQLAAMLTSARSTTARRRSTGAQAARGAAGLGDDRRRASRSCCARSTGARGTACAAGATERSTRAASSGRGAARGHPRRAAAGAPARRRACGDSDDAWCARWRRTSSTPTRPPTSCWRCSPIDLPVVG